VKKGRNHDKDGAAKNGRRERLNEVLLEALETELGGVAVYETALECVLDADLRAEWEKYLEQTREHVEALESVCAAFGIDPDVDTPGRQVVRHVGKSLVKAMNMALGSGSPEASQLVAAECVVHAETKDHMNWQLLKKAAGSLRGAQADALSAACEKYEDEEDEHLYHTQGWARELAAASLGLEAMLPPPEEEEDVHSAAGAARARSS
jgi:hypothetical protein